MHIHDRQFSVAEVSVNDGNTIIKFSSNICPEAEGKKVQRTNMDSIIIDIIIFMLLHN